MEFTFEQSPWELALEQLHDSIGAVRFLTLLEGEEEAAFEDALQELEQRHITLDASDLPPDPGSGCAAVRLRLEQQLVKDRQLPAGLEENDPLRLYLEEVAATPAAGDPQLLAQQLAQGDETVAPMLTNLMLSSVISLAYEMTGKGVLLMDLIQEGSLGLWQGMLSYQGGDFEAHCQWWIRQYLSKAVTCQARAGGVGQRLRREMQDYVDVDNRLLAELGRNPTLEEIAQQMHITVEEAMILEDTLRAARMRSRVDAQAEPAQPTEEDEQAVEDTAYFQSRQRIVEMLSTLTETEAQVLTLRFGLEGGLPLTPEQAGDKLRMTAKEIVETEAAALEKLRKQ